MMKLRVVAIQDGLLYCGLPAGGFDTWEDGEWLGWTFDAVHGIEEDEELGWGVKFGRTGTYLEIPKDQPVEAGVPQLPEPRELPLVPTESAPLDPETTGGR